MRIIDELLKDYDCGYGTDSYSDVKNRAGH
jgi:hypothetical protein